MSRTVEFIYDFASPNAYLAQRVLTGIAARTGAQIRLLPCLLGGIFKLTSNQSPMAAFAQVKGKLEYEALETQRFISKHQLHDFKWNPHFPVNTLLIMRATRGRGQLRSCGLGGHVGARAEDGRRERGGESAE